MKKFERENLESIIIPYGLKNFCPNDASRASASAKTHIDYLIGDFETKENEFYFDTPYRTDHNASLILTNINFEKNMLKIIFNFNKNN